MNYVLSFLFCGFVCAVAQLIYEYTKRKMRKSLGNQNLY